MHVRVQSRDPRVPAVNSIPADLGVLAWPLAHHFNGFEDEFNGCQGFILRSRWTLLDEAVRVGGLDLYWTTSLCAVHVRRPC